MEPASLMESPRSTSRGIRESFHLTKLPRGGSTRNTANQAITKTMMELQKEECTCHPKSVLRMCSRNRTVPNSIADLRNPQIPIRRTVDDGHSIPYDRPDPAYRPPSPL